MPKTTHPPGTNQLLDRLPPAAWQRLRPHLAEVPLKLNQVLHRARAPIDYAYFPRTAVLSALTRMRNGSAIEVATVGNEGMAGLPAFLGTGASPNDMLVQVAGDGWRLPAAVLLAETSREGPLRKLLLVYHTAYMAQVSQSVACNGLHTVTKRCCRWLLMGHDRVGTDTVPLTHEFLAIMLGVQRSSVTEVLRPLQEAGLIRAGRGSIRILNRKGLETASCECYRVVRDEFERLFNGSH